MDSAVLIGAIVLAVVVLVLVGIVITQRERLRRFEAKFGVGGIGLTIELSELVKREVARVSLASIARMAQIDRKLIDFWERGRFLTPEQGAERLSLIQDEIATLKAELTNAANEDTFQIAMQLRELYSKLLTYAREYWASSNKYVKTRDAVVAGLKRLEGLSGKDAG